MICFLPGENSFVCVVGAHHAHKTLSMHGARTSEPRLGTDPSAAKDYQVLGVDEMNVIQRNGKEPFFEIGVCCSPSRRELF